MIASHGRVVRAVKRVLLLLWKSYAPVVDFESMLKLKERVAKMDELEVFRPLGFEGPLTRFEGLSGFPVESAGLNDHESLIWTATAGSAPALPHYASLLGSWGESWAG